MPATNSLLAWPVRYAGASPGLRLNIIGFASQVVNLADTLGRNYWTVGDGQADADGGVGGVGDALALLQTALNTNGHGVTFTVTLTAAFAVQITISAGNFTIAWGDPSTETDLPGIYGFTATTTSLAGSCTGSLLPSGLWRPLQSLYTDTREREPTVGGVNVAESGIARIASLVDHPKKERTIAWLRVDQSKALVEYQLAAEPSGSFEYAWVNSIKLGRPMRLYLDETVRSPSSYAGPYLIANFKQDPLKRTNPSISNTKWGVGPIDLRAM